jgi:TonB-dependent receptor
MQAFDNRSSGSRSRSPAVSAGFALSLLALAMNAAFAAEPTDTQPGSAAPATGASAVPGKTKAKNGVASLDRVTVQAARHSAAAVVSRAKQEVAPNLINTTSQDEIRKLPDFNGGEAAARLPGVSLEVDTGQGRYVNIRGLDSDLTSTTYAGIHLPPTNPVTPQSGGRAFAFDAFPAGMIGSLTVTKTNKPEQDAEALGGTIEITPKEIPAGKDHFADIRLGSGVRDSRNTGVVDLAVTAGTRFGFHNPTNDKSGISSYSDKPFSIVGSLTYFKDASGADNWGEGFQEPGTSKALSQFKQAFYRFHRTTIGGGAELAYQPDADDRWYARYLHSGYTEDVNRQQQVFKMSGTPTQNADGSTTSGVSFQKVARSMEEQTSLNVFQLGGENGLGGGAKVDYNVAYTEGKDYRPYDMLSTFTAKPAGATITYNNQGPNAFFPTYTVNGANQIDPNLYKLSALTNNTKTYLTQEWSGGTNLTLPTHFFSAASDEQFKAGAYARFRTTTFSVNPYNSASVPNLSLAQALTGSPVTYYGNRYQNGYSVDNGFMGNLFNGGAGAGFSENPTDAASGLSQQSRDTENVFAAYAQEQMTFGRLTLLGGLRVEATRAQYSGYASNANLTSVTPVSAGNNYTNLFPSLQARYEFTPSLIGRASFSSTIARPGFNQVNQTTTIDPTLFVVTTGNPSLKPTTSNNFDVSIEQYLNQGGIVSLGAFDKELSNYIVANTSTKMFAASDPLFGSLAGSPTQVVSYANISKAHARGIEFDYDQHYTFLPGFLSGLGSSFNWTYVNSSGQIRPGENSALPSTANNTFNAQLYYEKGPFTVRLAGYYVGRSLLFVGHSSAEDQYTERRFTLDLGASYDITKNISLYVAAKNLTDAPLVISEGRGTGNRILSREAWGKTFLVGLTGKFE